MGHAIDSVQRLIVSLVDAWLDVRQELLLTKLVDLLQLRLGCIQPLLFQLLPRFGLGVKGDLNRNVHHLSSTLNITRLVRSRSNTLYLVLLIDSPLCG